jgi:hypothetical protein
MTTLALGRTAVPLMAIVEAGIAVGTFFNFLVA